MAISTSPLMPDVRFVGITRQGVSKGNAIREVAAAYHIDLRDVMYVGDAGNDLSALRIVGHPVAMANGDPAVIKPRLTPWGCRCRRGSPKRGAHVRSRP